MSEFQPLPFDAPLARYREERHEAAAYGFRDWAALAEYAAAVADRTGPVFRFERAVEAVIAGDAGALAGWLREDPGLVRARSTRVTQCDPPVHGAMLLHYVAANGVEGYRQRTPANAVDVARTLLEAGAEPDALAYLYGGECTTMTLLVSSVHPARAGVQGALVDVLVDYGASVEPAGSGMWRSPLMTALAFGYREAAEALVRRGARVAGLAAAAGMGRLEEAAQWLPEADGEARHRALALAAQMGHVAVVDLLLDAGEDPDRFNPPGLHAHSTPLHQAVAAGQEAVVRRLVERGARLDIEDRMFQGTPLGWARYLGQDAIAAYLSGR